MHLRTESNFRIRRCYKAIYSYNRCMHALEVVLVRQTRTYDNCAWQNLAHIYTKIPWISNAPIKLANS
jgi:hypothetical protein